MKRLLLLESSLRAIKPNSKILTFCLLAGTQLSCGSGLIELSQACIRNAPGLQAEALAGQELELGEISMIFSGGPSEYTEELSSVLAENQIYATFFVEGHRVRPHRTALRKAFLDGHLVGNGGYSGRSLGESKAPAVEMRSTDRLIENYVKGNMFLFHPPAGDFNERLRRNINEAGLVKYVGPIMGISRLGTTEFIRDDECWNRGLDLDACTENYLREIRRVGRGVIEFSDRKSQTIDLIRRILPVLENEGFSFKRLDQIPSINFALRASAARPLQNDNSRNCQDYE